MNLLGMFIKSLTEEGKEESFNLAETIVIEYLTKEKASSN